MPLRPLLTTLAAASAAAAAPLHAQAAAKPQDMVGDFRMLVNEDAGHDADRFTAGQRAAARTTLSAITTVLLRDPAFAHPRGHVLRGYRLFNVQDHPLAPNLSRTFALATLYIPYLINDAGKLTHAENSAGAGFDVAVNEVDCFLTPIARDARGVMYTVAQQELDPNGRGTEPDLDRCIALSKPGKPIWRPVSRERFLNALIARARSDRDSAVRVLRADLAELQKPSGLADPDVRAAYEMIKKSDPKQAEEFLRTLQQTDARIRGPAIQKGQQALADSDATPAAQRLHALRAELAALAPAERQEPALADTLWNRATQALARPGAPGAHRVVELDPGYFDPALPFSAPQLITLEVTGYEDDRAPLLGLLGTIDLPALRGLIR